MLIGECDKLHTLEVAKHPHVVPSHGSQTDHAGPKRRAHEPALTTSLTAWAMRSRSGPVTAGWTGKEMTCLATISVVGRSADTPYLASDESRWFGVG